MPLTRASLNPTLGAWPRVLVNRMVVIPPVVGQNSRAAVVDVDDVLVDFDVPLRELRAHRIAAHRCASDSIAHANMVGPAPEIEQPSAPAAIDALRTSGKPGISA